jgi:hypothetical protein
MWLSQAQFDDGALLDQTQKEKRYERERFGRVLSPKVKGTMLVADVFDSDSLEFFVLFSSVTSMVGNWAQVSYGAANSFQDGFALWRRQQGKVATSINWTVLQELGVFLTNKDYAGEFNFNDFLRTTRGLESFGKAKIEASLDIVMSLNRPQLGAVQFAFDSIAKSQLGTNALMRNRFHTTGFLYTPPQRRVTDLSEADIVTAVTDILTENQISDPTGVDSLQGQQILKQIKDRTSLDLILQHLLDSRTNDDFVKLAVSNYKKLCTD